MEKNNLIKFIYNSLNITIKCNILVLFIVLLSTTCSSQSYDTTFGLRLGDDLGFTLKQRIAKKQTLEFIYSNGILSDDKIFLSTFQHHMPLLSKRFNVYAGLGLGVSWSETPNTVDTISNYKKLIPIVIGGELTIGRFNISTDVIPLYILEKNRDKRLEKIAGISIRYVIFKRKKNGIFKKLVFWK